MLGEQGLVLACMNDPDIGPDFLRQSMALEAPGLSFVERLENPPEFADSQPDSGLKALVFARQPERW
ncbi:S-adenosylmethionine-dependent methyltransferase [compost metagenome]